MSSPKLLRILQAVEARLQVVSQASGYYTDIGCDIRKDRREPYETEMPCCLIYNDERAAEETRNKRSRCLMTVTVLGYVAASSENEARGIELLADIQRAVETGDMTLGGLVIDQPGLAFVSDEIFLPEVGANAVGARVTYTVPHIRVAGDPEIE